MMPLGGTMTLGITIVGLERPKLGFFSEHPGQGDENCSNDAFDKLMTQIRHDLIMITFY
jgi:hypothetical protein